MPRKITPAAIYTPPEAAEYALQAVKNIQDNAQRGARLNLAGLKDYFAPLLPGQLCAVIAQTSNYKSGFMRFWERSLAHQLLDEGRDEAVIHVSVEEVVEEQIYFELAREAGESAGALAHGVYQDWSKLEAAAIRVGRVPIYRIGDSLARPEELPSLYLSNIRRAVAMLVSGEVTAAHVKPAAIFVDYLQALPFDPEAVGVGKNYARERRLQVRADIYGLRRMAALFNCPVVVGVQAKQILQGAPSASFQMPGIYDGEESSSIAQRADRIIQLWMPKMTSTIGTVVEHGTIRFTVTDDLLLIKVGKQRGGYPSGRIFAYRVDFARNDLTQQILSGDV